LRPLAIDLYAGSFGWSQGLVAAGFRCIGFDIAHEPYHGPVPEHCELVLQDILTLHGSQFRNADLIVASPPCQFFSRMAMPFKCPWDAAELDRRRSLAMSLFNACFRIQREAIEATRKRCPNGHMGSGWDLENCPTCCGLGYVERHIPMVVENVKGAQPWVGRAKWHYGSFYLWGDVPALMPITLNHRKVPGFNFHQFEKTGQPGGSFQSAAVAGVKVASDVGRRTDIGEGARFTSRDCGVENGNKGFARRFEDTPMARVSSKSSARKAASAAIAKIPFALSLYIGEVYFPSANR
jgi:hypothetical protein